MSTPSKIAGCVVALLVLGCTSTDDGGGSGSAGDELTAPDAPLELGPDGIRCTNYNIAFNTATRSWVPAGSYRLGGWPAPWDEHPWRLCRVVATAVVSADLGAFVQAEILSLQPELAPDAGSFDTTLARVRVDQVISGTGIAPADEIDVRFDGANWDPDLELPEGVVCKVGPELRVQVEAGDTVWLALRSEWTTEAAGSAVLAGDRMPVYIRRGDSLAALDGVYVEVWDRLAAGYTDTIALDSTADFDSWMQQLEAWAPTSDVAGCPLHLLGDCDDSQDCEPQYGSADDCLEWSCSPNGALGPVALPGGTCLQVPAGPRVGTPCELVAPNRCVPSPVCLESGACGFDGDTLCDDTNPCTEDLCTDNGCVNVPLADGSLCGTAQTQCTASSCDSGVCVEVAQCPCSSDGDCPPHENSPLLRYVCGPDGHCESEAAVP